MHAYKWNLDKFHTPYYDNIEVISFLAFFCLFFFSFISLIKTSTHTEKIVKYT